MYVDCIEFVSVHLIIYLNLCKYDQAPVTSDKHFIVTFFVHIQFSDSEYVALGLSGSHWSGEE